MEPAEKKITANIPVDILKKVDTLGYKTRTEAILAGLKLLINEKDIPDIPENIPDIPENIPDIPDIPAILQETKEIMQAHIDSLKEENLGLRKIIELQVAEQKKVIQYRPSFWNKFKWWKQK